MRELDFYTQPCSHPASTATPGAINPFCSVPAGRGPQQPEGGSGGKQQVWVKEGSMQKLWTRKCCEPLKETRGPRRNTESVRSTKLCGKWTLWEVWRRFPGYSKNRATVTIHSDQVNFPLAINEPQCSGIRTQIFTQKGKWWPDVLTHSLLPAGYLDSQKELPSQSFPLPCLAGFRHPKIRLFPWIFVPNADLEPSIAERASADAQFSFFLFS